MSLPPAGLTRDTSREQAPAPSLHAAVGLIALYFALQAVAGGLIALGLGIATGFVHVGRGVQGIRADMQTMLGQPGLPAIVLMLTLGVASAAVIWLTRRRWPWLWPRAQLPGLGMVRPVRPFFFVFALVIGMTAPLLGGLLTQWLAHGHTVTQDIQHLGTSTPLALRLMLAAIAVSIGPLTEEMLFRGVLLSALTARCRVGGSVAISAMAFALVHLPGMQWQWYALPDLALLAGGLAWLRIRSGSLWPSVLAHGVNNLVAVAAWFVAVGR